ncbi:glycosyltransferase [Anaerolentibacter hominis]|uniref:glycosyltransferase n=1 Tax=Anaerolentibacter hominis TaxID=3079009 RepID=UPI0031B8261C
MRIAMMTNNYKPFIGGVPISIERLSEGLRALGHEVYIFAPEYENHREIEKTESGITIYRYRSSCGKTANKYVPDGMVFAKSFDRRIGKWFQELQIDVIHVHHPILSGNTAQILGRRYHIPVVFTYHTRFEQYLHYIKPYAGLERRCSSRSSKSVEEKLLVSIREKLIPAYIRGFANHCNMVFAPTAYIKNNLLDQGVVSPIRVLPTGLTGSSFLPDENSACEIRRSYLKDKTFLMCTVSRLAKEKNLDFLLQSLAVLKEKIGDAFRFLMIGDGPEKEKLEALAASLHLTENVVFMGNIENEQIRNYHAACDLFLFASKSETQGIVLLEAMAAGNPVVAVKASGVVDVVEDGVNGYMTEESAPALTDAVEHVLFNFDCHSRLRQGAVETARAYQDIRIARDAEKHYQDAIYDYCFESAFRKHAGYSRDTKAAAQMMKN